jgi:chromosomal replication initiator protein
VTNDSDKFQKIWRRVRERLRTNLGEDVFSSWFARIEAERFDGATVTLSVPTLFLRSWVRSRYGDKLLDLWRTEDETVRRIELRVRTQGEAALARRKAETEIERAHTEANISQSIETTPDGRIIAEISYGGDTATSSYGTPLDRRFSFATYVVGPSNMLAHAAALRVTSSQPGEPIEFNPLYIHGPVGTGKTHLMNAIAWEIRRRTPGRKVLFLSAIRFMSSFIEALKAKDTITFKKLFADIDVLLIDDMQFLQGKVVQQEFCHIFNALEHSTHQIVIAGDQPPARLEVLDDRMRSRLSGGLVAQITPSDLDLRRGILDKRISQMSGGQSKVDIPSSVLDFIARRIQSSGREVEGALNRIVAAHSVNKLPITVEQAAVSIADLISESHTRPIMIEDILRAVSGHFNVTRQDLLSARRHKSVVFPRQIGMYLAKTLTTRSLPEIGRKFGGRDHTTVLHAVRKIENLLGKDDTVRQSIDTLSILLRE